MTPDLAQLYARDLDTLREEMLAYGKEEDIWMTVEGINNSAGNLCLHMCGNLLHFFGAVILENGYVRQRDFEFSAKDVPLGELIEMIDRTRKVVVEALGSFDESSLANDYPLPFRNQPVSHLWFFLHLYGHLSYHLGQVNYHRRGIAG